MLSRGSRTSIRAPFHSRIRSRSSAETASNRAAASVPAVASKASASARPPPAVVAAFREPEPVAERKGGAERERRVRVAHGVADRLDAHCDGLAVDHERAMHVVEAPHRQDGGDRIGAVGMDPRHERRDRKRCRHEGSLVSERPQLAVPGRDHEHESERPVVPQEHDEDEVPGLAARPSEERREGRHLDTGEQPEVPAVVEEAALVAAVGEGPRAHGAEPRSEL